MRVLLKTLRSTARRVALPLVGGAGIGIGWSLATLDASNKQLVRPTGQNACCDTAPLTDAQRGLAATLRGIVGDKHVSENAVQRGARIGSGTALAVVRPGTLAEAVRTLEACTRAGVAVIPQGANTGLTGGSVPRDTETDRPTVVLSLRRLDALAPVDDGARVLCLAGVGIGTLGHRLAPLGREGHSELGSIFLNPSVAAGIAFGSGGTQLKKGPVYTERALYCRVCEDGTVELVNELGLEAVPDGVHEVPAGGSLDGGALGSVLSAVEGGAAAGEALATAKKCARKAADTDYPSKVVQLDRSVSRFNADTRGPCYNRSEGKVLILASVHETFPRPKRRRCLWVSTDSLETASALKAHLFTAPPGPSGAPLLPSVMEYMDGGTCSTVDEAGRALIFAIKLMGLDGTMLGKMWALKTAIESLPVPFADVLPDTVLYYANSLFPHVLPPRVRELTRQHQHHLLIVLADYGKGEDAELLRRVKDFAAEPSRAKGAAPSAATHIFECESGADALMLNRFRFSVAAAFRTWCVGKGVQGLSLDYALPKGERSAPPMPAGMEFVRRLRCAAAPRASCPRPPPASSRARSGCARARASAAWPQPGAHGPHAARPGGRAGTRTSAAMWCTRTSPSGRR